MYFNDGIGSISVDNKKLEELLAMLRLIEEAAGLAPMPKRDHATVQEAASKLREFINAQFEKSDRG